ncbi:YaaL family protein [Paenibacillus andongensis]|uniref:YaaL family protein n=1 Tax=Paenibacillus andongensis TaxID=2975482 RepID=UPI0021BB8893|nr:YaaL family protein [Paenibacillus andongensis]
MRPALLGKYGLKSPKTKTAQEELKKDKQMLIQEIRTAHETWVAAQAHFEFALDKDQIDYAIYAMEAAEKRFEMLIKQAKKLGVSLIDSDRLMEVK